MRISWDGTGPGKIHELNGLDTVTRELAVGSDPEACGGTGPGGKGLSEKSKL